jgi:uncharacterized protein with FMN-binding domain
MRRAIITIGSTAAGLAALLAFKSHPIAEASATAGTTTPSPTLASGPSSTGGSGQADGHGSAGGAGHTKSPSASASASASASSAASETTRTVTGTVADTSYGPMQVQIVLTGQRITKVNVLQQTDSGQESSQIDSFSIPKLTSETLTVQSARIDTVSGATATSQGYIQSLQSAIDQAMA